MRHLADKYTTRFANISTRFYSLDRLRRSKLEQKHIFVIIMRSVLSVDLNIFHDLQGKGWVKSIMFSHCLLLDRHRSFQILQVTATSEAVLLIWNRTFHLNCNQPSATNVGRLAGRFVMARMYSTTVAYSVVLTYRLTTGSLRTYVRSVGAERQNTPLPDKICAIFPLHASTVIFFWATSSTFFQRRPN